MELAIAIYAAVTVVAVLLAALWLRAQISALAFPLRALQTDYKDALGLISKRADKAESLNKELLEALQGFRDAIGDKRGLEAALTAERAQTTFLRERLAEMERAVVGLANPKLEATLVGQSSRDKAPPEPEYVPGPTRLQAASGGYSAAEPLVAELTRKNASTTFRPADYAGLAARESGIPLAHNGEAVS